MNPDQLESLLLDRELGELSPAVAELLEAHLARDSQAAQRAAELHTTLQIARAALVSPAALPPRILDVEQLRRAHRATQAAARRIEYFRLAACLAVGLGLGWFARPAAAPAESPEIPPPGTFIATSREEPRSTFWSVARLTASQQPAATQTNRSRLPLR